MNAVLSLSHFCETHGPTVLLSTQAFHYAGEAQSGTLEPSGIKFFGRLSKLKEYSKGTAPNVDYVSCEACESISGYITNDYENKISYLSTRLAIDSNVSSLLKHAAVRSLSCEVVPQKEGKVYFGDTVRGHVLSSTFFLKDAQARGFHRWYSVVVFMRDKHFLLNSWPFFQEHIDQVIVQLQNKANQVYTEEQNVCSQRALRLSSLDQKTSAARSLVQLTASTNVFAQLHLWFSWLLSTGAKRLEERIPTRILDCKLQERQEGDFIFVEELKEREKANDEETISLLRQLRKTFGPVDFQKILYSTLIGQQVIVRGPQLVVKQIINLLRLFLPSKKFRCQEFGEKYKPPEVCNIVGLDLSAAVPKSCSTITRIDIVPFQDIKTTTVKSFDEAREFCNFIIKTEDELPEKLPSLLLKIDKALSDESLTNRVVFLHTTALIVQWLHIADAVRETKKTKKVPSNMGLMQCLGVQEQDYPLIEFWTS